MALIKFYSGSDADIQKKEYEEGAIYYIFPDSNMTVGHIFVDIDGVRREISAAYNDTSLTNRIYALEQALLAPCTSVVITETEMITWVNASESIVAAITPRGTTDQIIWSVSDNNIAEVTSQSYNIATGESTAIITGLTNGRCTITCTCGSYSDSISCLVMDGSYYVNILLAENYDPNGSSFSWNVPNTFTFDHGQYIEASIDIAGTTGTKENLFSIGTKIDDYVLGPVFNFYTSQNASTVSTKLRIGSASDAGAYKFTGLEIDIPSTTIIIKMDATGVSVNGTLLQGVNPTQNNTIGQVNSELIVDAGNIKIGSIEGTNRSYAHYNYIKYVRYDGAL